MKDFLLRKGFKETQDNTFVKVNEEIATSIIVHIEDYEMTFVLQIKTRGNILQAKHVAKVDYLTNVCRMYDIILERLCSKLSAYIIEQVTIKQM